MKAVYMFSEGNKDMKDTLGGKGANLAEMTNLGLPIPQGFTITCRICNQYTKEGKMPDEVLTQIDESLTKLEEITGKKFGSTENPLLLSIRSGAPVSMPGMMDTVLNLGLNDAAAAGMIAKTGNERFVYDSYRRFIQMFADVALGVPHSEFEDALEKKRHDAGVNLDSELNAEQMKSLVEDYKNIVKNSGVEWPEDAKVQLLLSVEAVFKSWNLKRAQTYRDAHGIPHDLGTAVNVQAMVFGNTGENSGTGVTFSRNPSTGENKIYGEYLMNAQGEDVVAGIRTPHPISDMETALPEIYKQFKEIVEKTEKHYRDMQDMEFTIEDGKLYFLQTRTGKRTGAAAVRTAVEMVHENLITKEEAIMRVDPEALNQLLHKRLDLSKGAMDMTSGLPASPGAATGEVVFTANEAQRLKEEESKKVILVSSETTPEDIHGMIAAQGILTSRGGMTSHAAVVARGMGTPCVCGCESIKIGEKEFRVGDVVVREGDWITLDGTTGKVYKGQIPTIDPEMTGEFKEFMSWADEIRTLGVWTNADNPEDAQKARNFGAEGIGLCRTEHMFMGDERLPRVQEMIMSETEDARREALKKLLPFQRDDFYGIFKAMDGLPVTIRLLDPPLHEFLPDHKELLVEVTELRVRNDNPTLLKEKEELLEKVESLIESNPMLGWRGVRLGIVYPEISEMQIRAIFEAAQMAIKDGVKVIPHIMIPLVSLVGELAKMKEMTHEIAKEMGVDFKYEVGTMIELPRGCVTADEIAEHAEFFSFGTNDLTQTTFGFSRDDVEGKFFTPYMDRGVLLENPFVNLDQKGVGRMIEIAIEYGRRTNPNLGIGLCGEQGGDPKSIDFLQPLVDYVSCSPYRVPIARLGAAQSAIKAKKK